MSNVDSTAESLVVTLSSSNQHDFGNIIQLVVTLYSSNQHDFGNIIQLVVTLYSSTHDFSNIIQ